LFEKTASSPARDKIEERIKQLLVAQLAVDPAVLCSSDSSTPLLGHGIGLDSIEVMVLALAMENEFGIQIPDQDLTVDLFEDLGTLTDYISRGQT
jgi:acyl carrier protein